MDGWRRRFALVETEFSGKSSRRNVSGCETENSLYADENGAYADLGEVGDWGASWSRGEWGSCGESFRLKMKEDGLASSLGMRERG